MPQGAPRGVRRMQATCPECGGACPDCPPCIPALQGTTTSQPCGSLLLIKIQFCDMAWPFPFALWVTSVSAAQRCDK